MYVPGFAFSIDHRFNVDGVVVNITPFHKNWSRSGRDFDYPSTYEVFFLRWGCVGGPAVVALFCDEKRSSIGQEFAILATKALRFQRNSDFWSITAW
jgi:hypothetical protein